MENLAIIAMASPDGGQGGGLLGMLPFVLIIGIVYFLMIRPQAKKAKDQKKMIAEVKKGDKVVTIGGFHGTVVDVKDTTFVLSISKNTEIEIERSSVSGVTKS